MRSLRPKRTHRHNHEIRPRHHRRVRVGGWVGSYAWKHACAGGAASSRHVTRASGHSTPNSNDGDHNEQIKRQRKHMVHFGIIFKTPRELAYPSIGTSPLLHHGRVNGENLLSGLRGTLAKTRDGGPYGHGRGGAERRQKCQ